VGEEQWRKRRQTGPPFGVFRIELCPGGHRQVASSCGWWDCPAITGGQRLAGLGSGGQAAEVRQELYSR